MPRTWHSLHNMAVVGWCQPSQEPARKNPERKIFTFYFESLGCQLDKFAKLTSLCVTEQAELD